MPQIVIEVLISGWEIECCVPPPAIGSRTGWHLEFIGVDDDLARDGIWTVTHHRDGSVRLDRDGIEAVWNSHPAPPPPPGIRTLRGHLAGTAHGGIIPSDLPAVVGYVTRVRIVSEEFEPVPDQDRTWRRVPGTLTLRDVTESPLLFEGPDDSAGSDTGVLIDLAL